MKLFNSIFKYILRTIFLFSIIVIICAISFLIYMFTGEAKKSPNINFGITFSQIFAEEMGLDWQRVYLSALDEFNIKKLRLVAYWQKIEPNQGEYFFNDLDWQINEAGKRNADVILAVGQKLPRWPECHIPEWAKDLSKEERENRILIMLTEIIKHYQDNDTIKYWQIENEPFLNFGECPEFDKSFLLKEISLVRELDKKGRPIILTASGELSSWTKPALYADVLGTTLYRIIWNDRIGHITYPIPAVFYYKRANLVKKITGIDKIIIIELQAEPWGPKMIYETDEKFQTLSMDLDKFKGIIDYTYRTGFDEAYLWGFEWWYQRKEQGNDAIWSEAKKLWD